MIGQPLPVRSRVVIVGGGYAGIALARRLDRHVDVTLIDRQDAFFHRVAALRAAVDESWTDAPFISYDKVLTHGRFIHASAVAVDPARRSVELSTGVRVGYDVLIVATGTEAQSPARFLGTTAARAAEELRAHQQQIAAASSIVIVGGGPVGVELAGEIVAVHPGKSVELVEEASTLLAAADSRSLSARALRLLQNRGVKVHLGQRYHAEDFPEAQLTLWAVGSRANTDWLPTEWLTDRGLIRVDEHLRVRGWANVYAIGDATDVLEVKTILPALAHAKVAASNVRATLARQHPSRAYHPSAPKLLLVPVGPNDGVSLLPAGPARVVVGGLATRTIKGAGLFVNKYRADMGQPRSKP